MSICLLDEDNLIEVAGDINSCDRVSDFDSAMAIKVCGKESWRSVTGNNARIDARCAIIYNPTVIIRVFYSSEQERINWSHHMHREMKAILA